MREKSTFKMYVFFMFHFLLEKKKFPKCPQFTNEQYV